MQFKYETNRPGLGVLGLLAVLGISVLIVAVGPYLTISSINALTGEETIPFTWKTWASVLWLGMVLSVIAGEA